MLKSGLFDLPRGNREVRILIVTVNRTESMLVVFFRGVTGHMHCGSIRGTVVLDSRSAHWSFYRVGVHLENQLTGAGDDLHQLVPRRARLLRSIWGVHAYGGRFWKHVERLLLHSRTMSNMRNWHVINQSKKCAAQPGIVAHTAGQWCPLVNKWNETN